MIKWLLFLALGLTVKQEAISLSITVKGFDSNEGQAYIAIFNSNETFPTYGKQLKGRIVQISDKRSTVVFHQLTPGNYAAAVYHDLNKNQQLDKNLLGMPTEAYGFSNNARAMFSAPSFNDAKVYCTSDKQITITVK
mgnify:FL=1